MIDGEGLDLYKQIYNCVGTPGTTPSTMVTYTAARVALANNGCPLDKQNALVVDPDMEAAALGFANTQYFNPQREISRQYTEGTMGVAVGFKWSMDQNVARHTVGLTTGSTPIVAANATPADGDTTISTTGWANAAVLNEGDIISFAGVYGVNPISYRSTGKLRTFRVTADGTAAGNALTISIDPPLNSDATSVFQTVTALPAQSAAIYVYGVAAAQIANISGVSTPQALAFHKDAFTLAMVDLELPNGLDWSERVSNPKVGISMRLTRGFDIRSNRRYTRLEALGGWKLLRPELAVRICG